MNKALSTRQITIEAGENPRKPIWISLSGSESRADILVRRGARATIFDRSTSAVHSVCVLLEPESELTYVLLGVGSTRTLRSTVGQRASIHWHCTTIGGIDDAHELVSTLVGANATSTVDWIFSARGKERQSVSVRNIFGAPNGGGEITLKGVAEENAWVTCNGMIEITEQGRGTNTYLTEDVLMLDSTAHVDAIPALEIRTNDVKASHSATVSRVTAEHLFYLQSRGIDGAKARRMFVQGFLGALTERIADNVIRAHVRKALML